MTHHIFMQSMASMRSQSILEMVLSPANFQEELYLTYWSGTSSIARS
jgi:hypothetical protein